MMPRLEPFSFLFIRLNPSVSLLVLFSLVLLYSHQIFADVISDADSFEDGTSALRGESGKFVHAGKFRRSTRVKKGGVLSDFYSNSNKNNTHVPKIKNNKSTNEMMHDKNNKTTTTVSNSPTNSKSKQSNPRSSSSFSSLRPTSTATVNQQQYFPLVKRQSHRESTELTADDPLFQIHPPFNSEILNLFSRSNLNLFPQTRSHIHEHYHNHDQGSSSFSSSNVIHNNNNYLDEHFTKDRMKTNRFYFFNDRLPATRLTNVNIYGDGNVQPTPNVHALQFRHKIRQKLKQNLLRKLKKKLLKSNAKKSHRKKEHDQKRNVDKSDSDLIQNDLIDKTEDEIKEKTQNKKITNTNSKNNNNNKKDEWKPLYVTTKYRPFHFHLPILTNSKEPKELIDFQDILQEATEYKNPLDFNFAANPEPETLLRKKRGLGSFLKKLFHINKKTTTERPRPPAPPTLPPAPRPSPAELDSYEEEYEEPDYDETFGTSSKKTLGSVSASSSGKNRNHGRPKSDLEKKYKGKKTPTEPSKRVTYHADQHGDSEIDWLLPKSLRKSSILVRNDVSNPLDDDIDAEAMAGDETLLDDDTDADDVPEESAQPPKRKQRRRKNKRINNNRRKNWSFHDDDDEDQNHENVSDSEQGERHYDDDANGEGNGESPRRRGRRRKHKTRTNEDELDLELDDDADAEEPQDYPRNSGNRRRNSKHGSTEHVIGKPGISRRTKRSTEHFSVNNKNNDGWASEESPIDMPKGQKINPVNDYNFPIEQASKEELRLLHELFVNIVKGKCPKNFETTFVDSLEMNTFRIIDSSNQLEDTNKETSLEITKLIHQLVNCSIEAERTRDILEMVLMNDKFNNYLTNANEIEVGGPLYRSKRKLTFNSKSKSKRQNNRHKKHNGNSKNKEPYYPNDLINLSNFEFSLITFVQEECKANVNEILLQSAGQIILETIQNFYKGFLHISDEQYDTNLNVLQTCANLILTHKEEEARLKRTLQNLNIDSSWKWSKEVDEGQKRYPKSDMTQNGELILNSDLSQFSEAEMRDLLNEFKLNEGQIEAELFNTKDGRQDAVDSNIFSIFQDLADLSWKKRK